MPHIPISNAEIVLQCDVKWLLLWRCMCETHFLKLGPSECSNGHERRRMRMRTTPRSFSGWLEMPPMFVRPSEPRPNAQQALVEILVCIICGRLALNKERTFGIAVRLLTRGEPVKEPENGGEAPSDTVWLALGLSGGAESIRLHMLSLTKRFTR